MAIYKKFKKIWEPILQGRVVGEILSFFIYLSVRFIQMTSWTTYKNTVALEQYVKAGKPVILVLWHSRAMYSGKFWIRRIGVRRPLYAIFSAFRDGRFISNVYKYSGMRPILSDKGSSTSTKKVVYDVLRALKRGASVAITPDGPKGPLPMEFNTDSTFLFAQKAGVPIVPLYMAASRAWRLKTWDKFMIVKPFSKTVIEAGEFFWVAPSDDIPAVREKLTKIMQDGQNRVDEECKG